MNLPLGITFLRILIIPFFPLIYLEYQWLKINIFWLPYILLGILVFCEFTDMIDGMIARKKNQVTDLGKVLDPMADSIMHVLIFFTFTQGWISVPLLLVVVFLYREFLISSLRTICALKGVALAARTSGKIKTVLQAVVAIFIVLLLIPFTMGYLSLEKLQLMSVIAVAIAAVYSVFTAVEYIYVNRIHLKKIYSPEE